jgi:glycosyltransferase involved in cell wall biosynthesis
MSMNAKNSIVRLIEKVPPIRDFINSLYDEVDLLKSRYDVGDDFFDRFHADRSSSGYLSAYQKQEPLVSYCIATYNRGRLLAERSLRSILNQHYSNLDVIVVGDCCTDDTETRVRNLADDRIRFVNLPERGKYPDDPQWRWMVAGTVPMNLALTLARGDFITHLDDDDEHSPDRVAKLISFIRESKAEFVWHPFWRENPDGKWELKPCHGFRRHEVTTSSIFYHRWLAQVPWDINAYRYREPGDWNRMRKFKYLGVRAARYPDPFLRHYMERNQANK